MVQLPIVEETDTRDAFTTSPVDDYELIDFGNGRKLERWSDYLVESPDRLAMTSDGVTGMTRYSLTPRRSSSR